MSKISLAPDASGTGIFTIASPNSNTNRTLTLPDATGTVVISGTTPSLNGITFPATQVASADANTLDDYEEGTFSPSFSGSGGSAGAAAIAAVSGRYTKTGRIVTVNLEFYITNKGSWTGDFRITNLPFTLGNAQATAMAIAYAACTNVDASMIVARVSNNSNYIIIGTGANFTTPLPLTSVGLNEYWILSGTYEVA
jgi:ethanolamine utilization microcompartment shell protein EutS